MFLLLGYCFGTAALTWLLVGQLIRLAPRIGLLDRPNERSSHTRVTPRGGGIGFVLAIALALGVRGLLGDGREAVPGARPSLAASQTSSDTGEAVALARSGTAAGTPLPRDGSAPLSAEPGSKRDSFHDVGVSLVPSTVVTAAQLYAVVAAALFIAAISLRDDFKSLGAGLRFACHFAAAGVVVGTLGAFRAIDLPYGATWLLPGWLGTTLTIVWIVGLTNVYNFMDGIDGIAGGQGVAAGLGWLVAGLAFGAPTTAFLGAVLAVGCAGFLLHNWSPAKIFMGDVGSAFLGFLFAVVPLAAVTEVPDLAGLWPLFAGLVVWPFVGDGFLTFVRRLRKGEKVWEAHRSHLYQRLTRCGWTHARVSRLYLGWAGLTVSIAWLWSTDFPGAAACVIVLPPASLAALFLYVSKRERTNGAG
ncbi:MAG: glycosyltransferase family 4 protein [Opitutaceae bacterium]